MPLLPIPLTGCCLVGVSATPKYSSLYGSDLRTPISLYCDGTSLVANECEVARLPRVQEFVKGGSLFDLIQAQTEIFPPAELLRMTKDIARVSVCLHGEHRAAL